MHQEDKYIRQSVRGQAITNSLLLIGVGLVAPGMNPHIPSWLSLFIALSASGGLAGAMIRSNGFFSYPPVLKEWFLLGLLWGTLWGIALGLILGWKGGMYDLGMISWLAISILLFSLEEVVSSIFGALTWKRTGSSR